LARKLNWSGHLAKSWFKASAQGDVGEIAIMSDIGAFGVTSQDFQAPMMNYQNLVAIE
jgi:hypothetical protein